MSLGLKKGKNKRTQGSTAHTAWCLWRATLESCIGRVWSSESGIRIKLKSKAVRGYEGPEILDLIL